MRLYIERSSDAGPSSLRLFCLGCIIATRGYDFREGQAAGQNSSAFRPGTAWDRGTEIRNGQIFFFIPDARTFNGLEVGRESFQVANGELKVMLKGTGSKVDTHCRHVGLGYWSTRIVSFSR
jgi:hypothetical protein